MATKYGQEAIDALAERTAAFSMKVKVVMAVVLGVVVFLGADHIADTGDKTALVGLLVLVGVVGFFVTKIRKAKKRAKARQNEAL